MLYKRLEMAHVNEGSHLPPTSLSMGGMSHPASCSHHYFAPLLEVTAAGISPRSLKSEN